MTDLEAKIHVLDAAYKPFPTFAEWAARTTVDTQRWDRYKAALQNKPEISTEALRKAREVVKRAAALDTGAIEGLYETDRGFTFTVAFEAAAWEVRLAEKGEKVRSLFEAQMHAYDYVLDLATKAEPISEAAIRALHEVVCRAQDTYRVVTAVGPQEQELVKGRYKVLPNHVRTRDGVDHSYAPVDVTPAEMQRLVEEIRSEAFLAAHPVIQAAYAHYALVVIHPFPDGNGRVARALASAFTYRSISTPIMILSEHKNAYLDSLEGADSENYQLFVNFMLARSLDTIQLVKESLVPAGLPSAAESVAAIDSLFITRGGYTDEQVDESGKKLLQVLMNELTRAMNRSSSPRLRTRANLIGGTQTIGLQTHRAIHTGGQAVAISLNTIGLGRTSVARHYDVWVPKNAASEDDVLLSLRGGGVSFTARMDELLPSISGLLQIRVGLFADRVVDELLDQLRIRTEQARRKQQ